MYIYVIMSTSECHSVTRLAVHTENQQHLVFEENKEFNALENSGTTLTAWFELNKIDETAKNIKYVNIPCNYVFNTKTKSWLKRQRKQRFPTIGRLNIVSPKDSERFHLKLLLNHVKGATSFSNLRTHNGITYDTYRECALELGLIECDQHIFKIFNEACNVMMPPQLRKFFAWFLLAEKFEGNIIRNKYKSFFSEDLNDKENEALIIINEILLKENTNCQNFGIFT